MKPKESGKGGSCEKDFVIRRVASVPNLCKDRGQRTGNVSKGECCSGYGERVRHFITRKLQRDWGPTGNLKLLG